MIRNKSVGSWKKERGKVGIVSIKASDFSGDRMSSSVKLFWLIFQAWFFFCITIFGTIAIYSLTPPPQPHPPKIRRRAKSDHYNWFNKAKTPNKIAQVQNERKKTCYVCITNHSCRKSPDFCEEKDERLSIQHFQFFPRFFFVLFLQTSYN